MLKDSECGKIRTDPAQMETSTTNINFFINFQLSWPEAEDRKRTRVENRGRDVRTQRKGDVLTVTVADTNDEAETCTAPVLCM